MSDDLLDRKGRLGRALLATLGGIGVALVTAVELDRHHQQLPHVLREHTGHPIDPVVLLAIAGYFIGFTLVHAILTHHQRSAVRLPRARLISRG